MTSTLTVIPPAYLYQEFADDGDLQAFVAAYTTLTQQYLDTLNQLNLPIYTGLSGPLLDWVGAGVYGLPRPTIPGTAPSVSGLIDTYGPDSNVPLNTQTVTSGTTFVTTDDVYKRILTWHFYKGDGKTFNIKWLKKRVLRFLTGQNGTDPGISSTYPVSVTFGSGYAVTITVPNYPLAQYLQAGIQSGVLETPFQYAFTVVISGSVTTTATWANNSSATVGWTNNASASVNWLFN